VRNRGFSQSFYREKLHEKHFGFPDLEAFLVGFWEAWACSKGSIGNFYRILPSFLVSWSKLISSPDPENMLTMLQTWQSGDCSLQEPYNGSFEKAMQGINAKTLVLPGKTDLYFP